jgi:hypothetical protein
VNRLSQHRFPAEREVLGGFARKLTQVAFRKIQAAFRDRHARFPPETGQEIDRLALVIEHHQGGNVAGRARICRGIDAIWAARFDSAWPP